ncbi:transcriptional regulator [Opitutaceae bacterium TAV1]|nr:transcriptional regulator [Opitutaceae bacterium TAV1]
MKDIAQRAGVTKGTVSLALRGDIRISTGTRERIEKIAEELGYRPDPMLAALSARRGQQRAVSNLGVLVDDRWGPMAKRPKWLRNCLEGLQSAAQHLGYATCEFRLAADLAGHANPDRVLAGRGIRGVILCPFCGERPALPGVDWSLYSVVTIGNLLPEMGWHRVGTDAFAAMSLVCKKLRERGVTRIGLAQYLDTECRLRYEWLGSLLKEWHLGVDFFKTVPPLLYPEPDASSFLAWLRQEKPEVVVSNNEQILDWLEAAGVSVPKKVGIVLLNRDSSKRANITGISQHLDEVGGTAVELIHGLTLRGQRGVPRVRREMLIMPHWEEGATIK